MSTNETNKNVEAAAATSDVKAICDAEPSKSASDNEVAGATSDTKVAGGTCNIEHAFKSISVDETSKAIYDMGASGNIHVIEPAGATSDTKVAEGTRDVEDTKDPAEAAKTEDELGAEGIRKALLENMYGNVYEGPITLEQHNNEVEVIETYVLCMKTDLATNRPTPPSATVPTGDFKQELLDTIQKIEEARDSMALAGIRHPDLTNHFVARSNEIRNFLTDVYDIADVLEEDTSLGGKFAVTLAVLIGTL